MAKADETPAQDAAIPADMSEILARLDAAEARIDEVEHEAKNLRALVGQHRRADGERLDALERKTQYRVDPGV